MTRLLDLSSAGISTKFPKWEMRPHVTLAVFNDIDDTQCAELLERFANAHQAFSAFFRFRRDVQRNESGSKIGQGEINILEYKGSDQ